MAFPWALGAPEQSEQTHIGGERRSLWGAWAGAPPPHLRPAAAQGRAQRQPPPATRAAARGRAPRGSAGSGGHPWGAGSTRCRRQLGIAVLPFGSARTGLLRLPELGGCLGQCPLLGVAQRATGAAVQGRLSRWHSITPGRGYIPVPQDLALLLPPALGSAQPPCGDQEQCQQRGGSEQRTSPQGFNPAGMGSRRDGGGAKRGSACIPALPAPPAVRPPPARLCPGTRVLPCSPLLRWLLSFAAAND